MTTEVKDPVDRDLIDNQSTFGQVRKTPLVLYGFMVELMRQIYGKDNGLNFGLNFEWAEKPEDVENFIWIDSEYRWEDEKPEVRPAIYVSLGPLTYKPEPTMLDSGRVGGSLEEGEYEYYRLGEGTITFVHIGHSNGEVVNIVSATLDILDSFSDIIRNDMCFRKFRVSEVQPMAPKKESSDMFRGEVTVRYEFDEQWVLKAETPKLKRVVINAGIAGSSLVN